jgi:hypothetical protein
MLLFTVSKIEESHGLSKLKDEDDIKFRTEYIGEIIRQSLNNQREKYITELLGKLTDKQKYEWINERKIK